MHRLAVFYLGKVVSNATTERGAMQAVRRLGIKPAPYERMTCTKARSFNLEADAFYVGMQIKGGKA